MINKILLPIIASFLFIGLGALGIYGLAGTDILERDHYHHHHDGFDNWDLGFSYHCWEEDNEFCSQDYSEWCLREGEEFCLVDDTGECFEYNKGCLEELGVCYQYE
jgi:hypothetical protein